MAHSILRSFLMIALLLPCLLGLTGIGMQMIDLSKAEDYLGFPTCVQQTFNQASDGALLLKAFESREGRFIRYDIVLLEAGSRVYECVYSFETKSVEVGNKMLP